MVATNAIAKIAAVAAGLALVASTFAFAPAAKAATFMMDLTLGSTGADVTSLQTWLISKGYSIPAGATGYFGAQTQAALAAYQTAKGITPAAGYFGPITRGHVNAEGADMDDEDEDDNSSDSEAEGFLDEFDQLGTYSNEEVGEGEEDVAVLGVEMEATDADQTIERVTVEIDGPASPTGNDDLDEFITDVSLWLDGEELDRMEVDEASYDNDDDTYTFRFVGLDGMIEEDAVGELVVAVTGESNVDTADEGDTWVVRIPADGIRATSPNGVDDTYDSNVFSTNFSVESFASANDVELDFSLGGENPEESVAIVDNEGDDIVLLEGEMEADGSDIEVTELVFNLLSANADIEDIIDELVLEIDGDEESENISSSAGTSEDVTFDDLAIEVGDGDTVTYRLIGKSATSTVSGAQGITLTATTTVDSTEAEDASGEDLAAADITGSASGNAQHIFEVAPEIDVESIESEVDAIDNGDLAPDSANVRLEFDVTAKGGTIYLNGDDETTGSEEAFAVSVVGGSASSSVSSYTVTITGYDDVDNAGADNENFEVDEDQTVHVVIEAVITQAAVTLSPVLVGLEVDSIKFGTDRTSGATRSATTLNWTDLLDELESDRTGLVNVS